uniref:Uncharacterized protein n=1 Tax=Plectus sambesii TaxID=2011161 RepID=A0A914WEF3_9BILA
MVFFMVKLSGTLKGGRGTARPENLALRWTAHLTRTIMGPQRSADDFVPTDFRHLLPMSYRDRPAAHAMIFDAAHLLIAAACVSSFICASHSAVSSTKGTFISYFATSQRLRPRSRRQALLFDEFGVPRYSRSQGSTIFQVARGAVGIPGSFLGSTNIFGNESPLLEKNALAATTEQPRYGPNHPPLGAYTIPPRASSGECFCPCLAAAATYAPAKVAYTAPPPAPFEPSVISQTAPATSYLPQPPPLRPSFTDVLAPLQQPRSPALVFGPAPPRGSAGPVLTQFSTPVDGQVGHPEPPPPPPFQGDNNALEQPLVQGQSIPGFVPPRQFGIAQFPEIGHPEPPSSQLRHFGRLRQPNGCSLEAGRSQLPRAPAIDALSGTRAERWLRASMEGARRVRPSLGCATRWRSSRIRIGCARQRPSREQRRSNELPAASYDGSARL